jgi:hypothetical protein
MTETEAVLIGAILIGNAVILFVLLLWRFE